MSITINPNGVTSKLVTPRFFVYGKIYQASDDPKELVLGTRRLSMIGNHVLVGVSLDKTSTPWYETDVDRQFREVNVTVTVE